MISVHAMALDSSICKNLKSCAEWNQSKTGFIYDLGKLERRAMKVDKSLLLNDGNADLFFTYILLESDMTRIKRENGTFEIISLRDVKKYTFPFLKPEEARLNFDFYNMSFSFPSKEIAKNAAVLMKKYSSKHGRVYEATESNKVEVTDIGVVLGVFQQIAAAVSK